jgi:hypothetical protein
VRAVIVALSFSAWRTGRATSSATMAAWTGFGQGLVCQRHRRRFRQQVDWGNLRRWPRLKLRRSAPGALIRLTLALPGGSCAWIPHPYSSTVKLIHNVCTNVIAQELCRLSLAGLRLQSKHIGRDMKQLTGLRIRDGFAVARSRAWAGVGSMQTGGAGPADDQDTSSRHHPGKLNGAGSEVSVRRP